MNSAPHFLTFPFYLLLAMLFAGCLPEGYETDAPRSYPVVYLLHGLTGDHTTWYGGTNNDLYGPKGHKGMFMKKMLDTRMCSAWFTP
jgi:hypothetical protein